MARMMEASPPYKRRLRNYLIHKPLQREYTTVMIVVMMASCLLISGIVHFTMKEAFLGNPYRIGKVSPYQMLSDVNHQLVMRVSLTLLLCVIVTTVIGIVFLHRVAGPVYRFRIVLKKLAVGEIPQDVRLRQADYFKEVADELNEVFKHLREKKAIAQDIAARLEAIPHEGLSDPARTALGRAKENLVKLYQV